MKKLIFAVLIVLYSNMIQAELSMQLDATKVQKGESFRLIITHDQAPTSMPDLTPLQVNFTIIGTERSTNYSIINGKATSSNQWVIILSPKKTGTLTLPEIRVGQAHTQVKTIEVLEDKTNTNTRQIRSAVKQQDVLLKAKLSHNHPYVNEQVIYTVKLYTNRHLADVHYQAPQVEDALLIPLGNGQLSQTAKNGQIYSVEELKYALFPQKSGELKITPPSINALIYDAIPEPVHVQAIASKLHVKAVPTTFQGKTWIPAKQVNLLENYDQTKLSSIEQGDTLRRTITLQAMGTPAQLLPNLSFTSNDQFSVYLEKPIEKNSFRQFELIGTTTFNVTYLLNKTGKITIPAVEVPWFNSAANKEEIATLPPLTLNVIASANNLTKAATINPDPIQSDHRSNSTHNLSWGLAGGFALAWLITLLIWWKQAHPIPSKGRASKKNVLAQLKQACLTNQPELARTALLNWAHLQWPNRAFLNLADINKMLSNAALKNEINELSKVLYDVSQYTWQGERLWQFLVKDNDRCSIGKNKANLFKPLNPL